MCQFCRFVRFYWNAGGKKWVYSEYVKRLFAELVVAMDQKKTRGKKPSGRYHNKFASEKVPQLICSCPPQFFVNLATAVSFVTRNSFDHEANLKYNFDFNSNCFLGSFNIFSRPFAHISTAQKLIAEHASGIAQMNVRKKLIEFSQPIIQLCVIAWR